MEEGYIAKRPDKPTLLLMVGGGLVAAGLLLACFVLPAEFGIDPLGTGRALGLTDIAKASRPASGGKTVASAGLAASTAEATIVPALQAEKQASRWGESAVVRGAFIAQPGQFHVDSREITLAPGEGIEIKYHMQRGAGLVYSWTATAAVLYDFHGQPDVAPPDAPKDEDYFESYSREDVSGVDQFHGTLIAPQTGIQGWFWENTREETVKIKLTAAGFYDYVYQNRDEQKTRLKALEADSIPSHPSVPDVPFEG
jgi:hypothetical protein